MAEILNGTLWTGVLVYWVVWSSIEREMARRLPKAKAEASAASACSPSLRPLAGERLPAQPHTSSNFQLVQGVVSPAGYAR